MNVFLDIDGICCDFSHIIAEATGTDKPMESYSFDDFTPEQARAAKAALPRAYTEGRPYECMAELSHRLAEHNTVRYLTARPESARKDTIDWLVKHGFCNSIIIFSYYKASVLNLYNDAVIVEDYGKNIEEILDGSDAKVVALCRPKQKYTHNWYVAYRGEAPEYIGGRLLYAIPDSLLYVLAVAGAKLADKKEEKSMNLDEAEYVPLKPEEGKRYTLRNGKVTHGLKPSGDSDFPFMGYVQDSGLMYWSANGRFLIVPNETEFDLVEEYNEPVKIEANIDYKAQLASMHKSLTVQLLEKDEGFAKAAEELAQKLSHAFLENPFAQLKRRKGQSPALWEAACLLIEQAGVVVEFCDKCVKIH